ncbi:MAG: peptidase [Candidatus Nitrosotenuis sp.]
MNVNDHSVFYFGFYVEKWEKIVMQAILTLLILLVATFFFQYANGEEIPSWVKNNARWWADGTIADSDFIQGIQYLITQNIIKIPETTQGQKSTTEIPVWIKNNARWWADGTISDSDFIQGIQFLIKNGIMVIEQKSQSSALNPLDEKLAACKQKETQREQYECEKSLRTGNESDEFKLKSTKHVIGPITFYYGGATVEKSGGKDIVNLKFLVENTGSNDNITLYCTGPSVCNYDISDGTTTYKYSANDFTSGQIVLKPGASRFFNMLFGPAIGYGSYVDFKFDPSKQYVFNVKEPWGSGSIPLNLK